MLTFLVGAAGGAMGLLAFMFISLMAFGAAASAFDD
jgi:hypothetical protein